MFETPKTHAHVICLWEPWYVACIFRLEYVGYPSTRMYFLVYKLQYGQTYVTSELIRSIVFLLLNHRSLDGGFQQVHVCLSAARLSVCYTSSGYVRVTDI